MILHVLTEAAWQTALAAGEHAPPELARDGFLHCCTEDQLDFVLSRHFAGRTELLVIGFEQNDVGAEVSWVRSEADQAPFPHLFGPISCSGVREVRKVR